MEQGERPTADDLSMKEILDTRDALGAEIDGLSQKIAKAERSGEDAAELKAQKAEKEELYREIVELRKQKAGI